MIINNFLIIKCIGKDDRLGLRINKDFFIHIFENKKNNAEHLLEKIFHFLTIHKVKIDDKFTVIVNQGPGSFSGIRIALAIAKGLEISKNVKLFGYKDSDLKAFDQENIEKLIQESLVEKKLIKPVYLS